MIKKIFATHAISSEPISDNDNLFQRNFKISLKIMDLNTQQSVPDIHTVMAWQKKTVGAIKTC